MNTRRYATTTIDEIIKRRSWGMSLVQISKDLAVSLQALRAAQSLLEELQQQPRKRQTWANNPFRL